MSHAGGSDKDKRKGAVTPSEAATSDTPTRRRVSVMVKKSLKKSGIVLLPQQVADVVSIVFSRMMSSMRKGDAKKGSSVEISDAEISKNVDNVMNDDDFKERLKALIAKGPGPTKASRVGASVQTEEAEEMKISAPIIPDPQKEAKDKLKAELELRQLRNKPARNRESLGAELGMVVPPPPPRDAAARVPPPPPPSRQPGARVPPPLPKSRPVTAAPTTPPPSGAQPVVHSPYGGVKLNKPTQPEKSAVKKVPSELENAYAARVKKPDDDDGNPRPKRPGSGSSV